MIHVNVQNIRNELKRPEHMNFTIKYWETFFGRQTALASTVVKINRFKGKAFENLEVEHCVLVVLLL